MHKITATRIRYGYRRVHIMLRREGWTVGKNLVWRLYREEGLALHPLAATPAQDGRAPRSKVPAEPAQ
jgi:transposase InsO family protein